MSTSQIPAYLDALAAGLSSSLSNVTVVDGPPLTWYPDDRLVLVLGAQPGDGPGQAASGGQDYRTVGLSSRIESITVQSTVYAWTGDEGAFKACRDACFLILAGVENFLWSDVGLRSIASVDPGHLASVSVEQERNKGSHCRVMFSIDATAYLN